MQSQKLYEKLSNRLINLEKLPKLKQNQSISSHLEEKGISRRDFMKCVGTQRIWPARAFTLGHLTHNDLASVRIAKRATKSL